MISIWDVIDGTELTGAGALRQSRWAHGQGEQSLGPGRLWAGDERLRLHAGGNDLLVRAGGGGSGHDSANVMCRLALVIHGLRQLSAGGRLREDDYTRLDWVDLLVVTSRGTSTRPRETARWIAVLLEPLVVRLRLPSVARVGYQGFR